MIFSSEVCAEKKVKSIAFKKYENTVTIKKGETIPLKVAITPKKATNKTLKWTSSNKKIVSVTSKGVMKGRKNGKATITAKTTDGSKKKIKLKVTVGTKIEQIAFFNGENLTELKVGSQYTLKVDVLPSKASNKKLKWSTSDSKIATVSQSGVIKAISNGVVKITAKSTDGTNKEITKTLKIVSYIKTIRLSLPSSSVYLSALDSSSAFVKKGQIFQLRADISPENATDKTLVWSSGNQNVATVSADGRVTAVGCGVTVITAQAADPGRKKKTFTIYVSRIDKKSCQFTAHRGRSDSAPENSMAAIRLALESRFDSVEFDIWKTQDNEFVVSHDQSLKNSCGVDKKVTEMTLSEVVGCRITSGSNIAAYPNEYIPSLEQILKLAGEYENKILCIELKQIMSSDMLAKLLKTIEVYGLQDRTKIITFYKANIIAIRKLVDLGGESIALEYLCNETNDDVIQTCITYHASLGAKYSGLTEQQVITLHDHDIAVNVWNIPDFFTACHMIYTMGVDIITADYQFFE